MVLSTVQKKGYDQPHTVALSFLPYAAGKNEQVDFFAGGIYNVYTKGGADYASSS